MMTQRASVRRGRERPTRTICTANWTASRLTVRHGRYPARGSVAAARWEGADRSVRVFLIFKSKGALAPMGLLELAGAVALAPGVPRYRLAGLIPRSPGT